MLRSLFVLTILFVASGVCLDVLSTYNPANVTNISCFITDMSNIYVGTTDGNVHKINATNFSVVGSKAVGYPISTGVLSGLFGIFGTYEVNAHVIKLALQTMNTIGTAISLVGSNDYLMTSMAFGTYAYFGSQSTPAVLYKIDLAAWALNNTLVLDDYTNYGVTSVVQKNDMAYLGFNGPTGLIYKVNLTKFTQPSTAAATGEPSAVILTAGASYNGQVFFAERDLPTIVAFDKTVITNFTFLQQNSTIYNNMKTSVSLGKYAYFGTDLGRIVQFNMSNSEIVDSLYFPGMNFTASAVIGSFAYFGAKNGSIVKLNITVDCPGALGGILLDGYSRDIFTADSACGSCDSVKEVITCSNGVLLGNTTSRTMNCTVRTDCPCPGAGLSHNQTITLYSDSIYCGDCSEISSTITCLNGVVTGNVSQPFSNCTSLYNCSCTNSSIGTLNNGESRDFYSAQYAPCGTSCDNLKQIVQCNNGKIVGYSSNLNKNCSDCVIPLENAFNATLNSTSTIVTMYFPESPNTTVTYSFATNTSSINIFPPFFSL